MWEACAERLAERGTKIVLGARVTGIHHEGGRAVALRVALARECVTHLRRRQPTGPYHLAGVCFGGVLAFEMARLLEADGETVRSLALIDALNPAWRAVQSRSTVVRARWRQLRWKLAYHSAVMRDMSVGRGIRHLASRASAFFGDQRERAAVRSGDAAPSAANRRNLTSYVPGPFEGEVLVLRLQGMRLDAPALGWAATVRGRIEIYDRPFHHNGSLAADGPAKIAAILRQRLALNDREEAARCV